MAKANHRPTDSALAHLIAATRASGASAGGELKKADDFIKKIDDPRHKKELRAFWDIVKEDLAEPAELAKVRTKIEAWMKKNFPTH